MRSRLTQLAQNLPRGIISALGRGKEAAPISGHAMNTWSFESAGAMLTRAVVVIDELLAHRGSVLLVACSREDLALLEDGKPRDRFHVLRPNVTNLARKPGHGKTQGHRTRDSLPLQAGIQLHRIRPSLLMADLLYAGINQTTNT